MFPAVKLLCRSGALSSRLYQLGTTAPSFSTFLHGIAPSASQCSRCLTTLQKTVVCRTLNSSSGPSRSFLPIFTCSKGRLAPAINRRSVLWASTQRQVNQSNQKSNKTIFIYISSVFIVMIGVSYVAVPLYRLFCAVRLTAVFRFHRINECAWETNIKCSFVYETCTLLFTNQYFRIVIDNSLNYYSLSHVK